MSTSFVATVIVIGVVVVVSLVLGTIVGVVVCVIKLRQKRASQAQGNLCLLGKQLILSYLNSNGCKLMNSAL